MKYKLLKMIEPEYKSISVGNIFEVKGDIVDMDNGMKVPAKLLIEQGFIEEVKETPKPKFVVGEYVTCEYGDGEKKYLNISEIRLDPEGKYEYNRYFSEKYLREPTTEELDIYFA